MPSGFQGGNSLQAILLQQHTATSSDGAPLAVVRNLELPEGILQVFVGFGPEIGGPISKSSG
jgi:hypothetical protein